MDRYRAQVLQGSVSTFLGAAIAGALALTLPTPSDAFVPLTGAALVLIGAYYLLGEREALAVAWPAPLVAAAIVFLSRDPTSLRTASLTLVVLSIASALTWRIPAYFAEKGAELGRADRD